MSTSPESFLPGLPAQPPCPCDSLSSPPAHQLKRCASAGPPAVPCAPSVEDLQGRHVAGVGRSAAGMDSMHNMQNVGVMGPAFTHEAAAARFPFTSPSPASFGNVVQRTVVYQQPCPQAATAEQGCYSPVASQTYCACKPLQD
mmetsp:Transcript_37754/g.86350  ORF Transcript_37754/g.86350 Transcript_37754/m.86350 type:complete len:143 (+) Transcript_37754:90-518(+)|eukprot:CAMPEP_0184386152 /NCGR_PEP_ID=MMETSP0007-20130409/9519_1 /TAXON_ID=97485 /ORGANISM="Prymnesium parvum, Strain Texoma1" /LENGTH=142 /DNA_ID=CAMNT_0026733873 /DNA_START=79 /DNA_END=507 /DNA_ORIENTATION=-